LADAAGDGVELVVKELARVDVGRRPIRVDLPSSTEPTVAKAVVLSVPVGPLEVLPPACGLP
jgi:hypothetical protein